MSRKKKRSIRVHLGPVRDDVEDHEENVVVGLIRIVVSKNNEKTRTAESTRGERYP